MTANSASLASLLRLFTVRCLIVLAGVLALAASGIGSVSAQTQDDSLPWYDIVVVGGEGAVSAEVFAALESSTSGSVARVAGSNRYATAAAVSQVASEPGVPVVFVATGENFPDALVGGPVAARRGGSLLLVGRDAVPQPMRHELARLKPQRVVALGGTQAISAGVLAELGQIAGAPVDRLAGPNRFATAAAVSRMHFSPGVPVVYIATGENFPDALTTVPAAAVEGGPILLTGANGLPLSTIAELERLAPERIVVVGGSNAVSEQVKAALAPYAAKPVERIGGATRYGTAAKISEHAFPAGAGIVFVASGADFPDALAIGAVAGASPENRFALLSGDFDVAGTAPGPVLLAHSNALPAETVAELVRLGQAVPAPVAQDQQLETAFETPVDVTLEATGGGAATMTFAVSAPPQHGALTGTPPDLTYTPDAGFHATDSFEFTASIGGVTSAPGKVTIIVRPPDGPAADSASVTTEYQTPVAITLTGSSPAGLPLTFAVSAGPADGTLSGTPPNMMYTPDLGFLGADSFAFTASDGVSTSAPATVEISVVPQPPAAHDVAASTDQDQAVILTLDGASSSGQPLTYHYAQPDNGTVTGAGPDVTYTPDPGFHGSDAFTYHVNDGFNDSNAATATVTVQPLAPVAHDQSVTVPKNAVDFAITLQADSPSGGPLAFAIVDAPDDGSAALVDGGPDLAYTPDVGFEGTDSFTFLVNDTFNDSNIATVTVSVHPEAPVAHDVAASTDQDTPAAITLDADNFSANPLTYHYDQPSDGTVTGTGPNVTYTPDPAFYGTDTFTYHVNDGFNDSNTATVTATVNLSAQDYDFDTLGNTLLEVGVAPSGDPAVTIGASLLDDAAAGFEVIDLDTAGTAGDVEWNAEGGFSYKPAAGFTGDDTFTYTISDGDASATGTVTITVSEMVWYVDNQASGDGRSWAPFVSLAEAEAESGAGDVIFVYEGSGAYDAGIALQDDQLLLGEQAGLTVSGHVLVDPGDRPALAPATGDAIALASGAHVAGLDITGGAERGLVAVGVGGSATVADVDVSGVTGDAVYVHGGSVALIAAVSVTNSTGHAVSVTDLSSGAISLSGAITDTGDGIALSGNTGSTIAFTGMLDLSTSGSTAFSATGGGTVTATAAGSTVAAAGARGLLVDGTSIGAAGLRFSSISASDAQHGIELSDAGSGPLVVDGDASTNRNGAGGTIAGMSSHGVTLLGTGPVTLRNMNIEDNQANGLRAEDTTGLTVIAASMTGNSDDQNNPATRNSLVLRDVTGSVRVEDSIVNGSVHNQVDVESSSGTVTIEVLRSELRQNGINSGLQVEALGTSNVTLEVADSTFADHHATGLHAFARNTATLTVVIDGNTFEDNNIAVNLAAQHTAALSSTVTGNTASGHPSHSINVTVHDDALHETTVVANDIDGAGTVASVGIRLVIENDSLMRALVEDNSVSGLTSGLGVRVLARESAGQLHLMLSDNDVQSTSSSPAYSLEILEQSYMCGMIEGNTGISGHPSRDLLVDLFDPGSSADIEDLALGQRTQAEFEAHLAAANAGPRIGTLLNSPSNVFGVPSDTCERPS